MDIPTLKVVIELVEHRVTVLKEGLKNSKNLVEQVTLSARIEEQQLTQIALSQALIDLLKFDITVKSN